MRDRTPAEVEETLWKALEHHKTGMLGLSDARQHFQPMTGFAEPESKTIWFFASKDNDLMEAAGIGGAEVMFTLQSHDLYACIEGRLTLDTDRARIDRFWSPAVAAWYPGGKDDPNLVLLRMDTVDAAVWVVDGGPVKYLLQVATAKATKSTPDVGERRDVNFH
jgi:general stress protein 26